VIPRPYLYLAAFGTLAASLAACYGFGYSHARQAAEIERAKIEAVAIATNSRFRKLEKEVADAQAGYVKGYIAARDRSNADWLRLKASSAGRVPVVCPESGGVEADRGDGVEAPSGPSDRDLLPALVGALETGERLEATLALCQAELRQCAGMR
jgi:hypothetical protein